MVDFRRWILALAVLTLFAGLASAATFTCATNVSAQTQLRSEGFTEQTGDITIQCFGGDPVTPGNLIPTVNITVFFNTQVTSRLFSTGPNVSEALLLIDEPASSATATVPGFGTGAPQRVCGVAGTFFGSVQATAATGCTEFATNLGGTIVATDTSNGTGPVGTAVAGANVFQGIVSGNSVTFLGVPVLPPVSALASRTFRITNIRVNATTLSGGSAAGFTPVIAGLAVSNPSTLPVTAATPTVGIVQPGLAASASSATNRQQCVTSTKVSTSVLTFTENFATAFKTRIAAQTNTVNAGQGIPSISAPGNQNVPGSIYASESNFVLPVPGGGTAGLADFGTRLKATFNSVPAGVHIFVSVNNVLNAAVIVAPPAIVGGSAANTTSQSYAQLVLSENGSDGNGSGFFPIVNATDNGPGTSGVVPIFEITPSTGAVTGGSYTAVWEVMNTSPSTFDTLKFAVYTSFVANVAGNSPPAGTGTVALSFAPTPPSFTATTGGAASTTLAIPRFGLGTIAASNVLNIGICRTVLLYPFVTNSPGFDTGLAIANTSTDTGTGFLTGPQDGSCKLNWYGGTTSPAQGDTGVIKSGFTYVAVASGTVPGFQGYMIAVCSFQYAHGFAFISDVGVRNFAMGYLALVIPDPASQVNAVRNASTSGCGTGDINCGAGEGEGH